jgi:hypothetical protein
VNKRIGYSLTLFQHEYGRFFKSAGKKGDYKALASASTVEDEPKLKALRERILQRDSDEANYDYQKVNEIILMNRMVGHERLWRERENWGQSASALSRSYMMDTRFFPPTDPTANGS